MFNLVKKKLVKKEQIGEIYKINIAIFLPTSRHSAGKDIHWRFQIRTTS